MFEGAMRHSADRPNVALLRSAVERALRRAPAALGTGLLPAPGSHSGDEGPAPAGGGGGGGDTVLKRRGRLSSVMMSASTNITGTVFFPLTFLRAALALVLLRQTELRLAPELDDIYNVMIGHGSAALQSSRREIDYDNGIRQPRVRIFINDKGRRSQEDPKQWRCDVSRGAAAARACGMRGCDGGAAAAAAPLRAGQAVRLQIHAARSARRSCK
jgi:hypothetical protein